MHFIKYFNANPDTGGLINPLTLIPVTTTLYPVDVQDGVDLSFATDTSSLRPLPEDSVQQNVQEYVNNTYTQLRWFYEIGPYEDSAQQNTQEYVSNSYTQLRWFYEIGPYDDSVQQNSQEYYSHEYNNKLVEADTPDEGLDLLLATATSSMTSV